MNEPDPPDFPVARRTIDRLEGWLATLAAPILPPKEVPVRGLGFYFAFRDETPYALMVGKAVRMISGIRAAMVLADLGFIAECGTVLRVVSDSAMEIGFVAEGCLSGSPNRAQRQFIEQYFAPFPPDLEEFEGKGSLQYVSRAEIIKAYSRMGGYKDERLAQLTKFVSHGYDKFVHVQVDLLVKSALSCRRDGCHGDRGSHALPCAADLVRTPGTLRLG
jgi:hypothetical protein